MKQTNEITDLNPTKIHEINSEQKVVKVSTNKVVKQALNGTAIDI